jgi:aldose 1-epimerase
MKKVDAVHTCVLMMALFHQSASMHATGTSVSAPKGFGITKDGVEAHVYTLHSADSGISIDICTYGASITRVLVPDKDGRYEDIVLGCNDAAEYESHSAYFGGIVGRVANRIRDGKFTLQGKSIQLEKNNGPNALHGGEQGFNKKHWDCKEIANGVELSLTSPDGDQGYPGQVLVRARYTLVGNTLRLEMEGQADTPTPLNLAQHSYFNLGGHGSGKSVLRHRLKLYSSFYTPMDEHLPTGEVAPVKNTPFDFSDENGKEIGQQIQALGTSLGVSTNYDQEQGVISIPPEQEALGENKFFGFDDNFVVDDPIDTNGLRKVAFVIDPSSGRTLLVQSDVPGVQFYTGNYLDDTPGKKFRATTPEIAKYSRHAGFCLETQHFPDSIGADETTPFGKGASVIVDATRPYVHTVQYSFGTQKSSEEGEL